MSAIPAKISSADNGQIAATVPVGVRTRAVVPGRWVLVALAAAVALAAVVFVLLPGWLAPHPSPAPPITPSVAVPTPTRGLDAAEAVRQRLAAEEAEARDEAHRKAVRDQRAEQLSKVLERMNAGATHAQAGDWDAARGAYAEAAKLDPAYGPAREALARVERNVANQRFTQLVTRGLTHLERSEWMEAEQAFDQAARLRPGDRSAADGLARAKEGHERNQLAGIRSEGQQLESAERWTEALAAYRRAATVDPTLDFAKRGIERSERMAGLHAEFDALLADPKRLVSPRVREEARRVLASADSALADGPRLAQTRQRLEAALRRATTPIAVRLASDDATDVVVYRIGPLGRFQAREIELAPGTYTVVGSRSGYRDVRIELIVDPEAPAPRIFIACREPV